MSSCKELSPEHIVYMLGLESIPLDKRKELAREQIEMREQVIAHLRAWLEVTV
jgi:hypothetical protein